MKRFLAALLLCLLALPLSSRAVQLTLDGQPLNAGEVPIYDNATYVPFRTVVQALRPQAQITWENGQAVAQWKGETLIALPGENYLLYNGNVISLELPVRLEDGRTLLPVRPLCELLDVQVEWHSDIQVASLHTGRAVTYSGEDLYWLSHIISAESQGEPWEGKLAVGYVVLNRVRHPEFPNTIYDVIFDDRWGGQFEPVRNGTVYLTPTEESVRAATACLSGDENPIGDSLYFLAPSLTSNHWTMENRDYVTTIGAHWFYR